jgi:hypothetical protein
MRVYLKNKERNKQQKIAIIDCTRLGERNRKVEHMTLMALHL